MKGTEELHNATPTVHGTVVTEAGTIVIYSFDNQRGCHIAARLGERDGLKWQTPWTMSSQIPCPGANAGQPYSDSRGAWGGFVGNNEWMMTAGRMFDPAITDIDIVWSDGEVTPAVISGDIYYGFREGNVNSTAIRAYDSSGKLVKPAP